MIPILDIPDHRVLVGSSLAEHDLPDGLVADALIADPPYSARTHAKSDPATLAGPNSKNWIRSDGKNDTPANRRSLDYRSWDPITVFVAVGLWAPRVRGWIVILTDHTLAPHWTAALESEGLYVFAPLPFFSPGSRVRLTGDGPSSWTCWIVVARPKHEPYAKWGTLPGGYVFKPERMPVVGGKPLALMRALVRDYSNEGDLIWDPCCGGGTTMVAARELGRRSIGMDIDREHAEIAARRVSEARALYLPGMLPRREEQQEMEL